MLASIRHSPYVDSCPEKCFCIYLIENFGFGSKCAGEVGTARIPNENANKKGWRCAGPGPVINEEHKLWYDRGWRRGYGFSELQIRM